MIITVDDLRTRLLDGLPPLVQGMAEGIVIEWQRAVAAVPELELLAEEDLGSLAALHPVEREHALRRRWQRLHDVPGFELRGRPVRLEGVGRAVAAR